MDTSIKAVGQTRAGGLLVEFGPDAAVGEKVIVSLLEPRVTLEIKDIDRVTDVVEVEEALRKEFRTAGEMKVEVTSENSRGQRVAIVDLIERDAKPMLDKGKVKVGWVV